METAHPVKNNERGQSGSFVVEDHGKIEAVDEKLPCVALVLQEETMEQAQAAAGTAENEELT